MKFETTKLVNIYPTYPIVTIAPPIRCPIKNVRKSIPEIRECIIKRAIVEEILDDGSIVNLDFANYDKDNSKKETIEDLLKSEDKKEEKPEKKEWEEPKAEEIIPEKTTDEVKDEIKPEEEVDAVNEKISEEEPAKEEVIETPVEEAVVEEPTAEAEVDEDSQEAISDDDKYGL